jgi:hypothetical protein
MLVDVVSLQGSTLLSKLPILLGIFLTFQIYTTYAGVPVLKVDFFIGCSYLFYRPDSFV